MRLVVNATAYGVPPGGAGLRARALFGALRGHDLLFLLAEDTPDEVIPPGAETRRLPVRAGAPLRRWLRLRLPAEGDLLFTDHYPASASVPTVITLHDTGRSAVRRALVRRHLRRAHAVVAVSEAVRTAWQVDATVIPNGISVPEAPLPPPGDHLLFCDPGLAHKDAAFARRVAAAVGRQLREVGRGVRWLPHEELMRELAGAAAVLCPSRAEGFGMVALEALALGRPVVASDLPGHREVLGACAFLAPVGDLAAWRASVELALRAPAERCEAGRAHARRFGWERAAERLEALISRPR